ncbi:MAG: dihydroorotase family protein [Nanoarchaeota archaeon]
MIDCHVHLRDWNWKHKETIEHGLHVAEAAGLSGVFDMPNTEPVITSRELVERRLKDARKVDSPVFYGLYVGLTSDPEQIKEAVECVREYFPRREESVSVVGLKMFAGKSVGDLSVVHDEEQMQVYWTLAELNYRGVLAVHCEDESQMHPELWDPENPISHCKARPKTAEIRSITKQILFANEADYQGHLHILHVTTHQSVNVVNNSKKTRKISCGVTPNHLLLNNEVMKRNNGIAYKVNPPLRDEEARQALFDCFKEGLIDVLESDHAPHSFEEKFERGFLSGIPGLVSWPGYVSLLVRRGSSPELIDRMTHDNINRIFGTKIQKRDAEIDWRKLACHSGDYCFNPLESLL